MKKDNNTRIIAEIKENLSKDELKKASKLANMLYKKDKNNPVAKFWKSVVEIMNLLSLYKKVPTEKLRNDLEEKVHTCMKILDSISSLHRKTLVLQDWYAIKLLMGAIKMANLSESLALHLVDMVLEANPDHYDVLLRKVTLLLDIGKIEEAVDICQNVLERHPGDTEFMIKLANGYALLGLKKWKKGKTDAEYYFNEARNIIERVLKKDPYNCEAKWLIASIIIYKDNFNEALEVIDEALQMERCTQYYKLLDLKAELLRKLGRYKEALDTFDNLLNMNKLNTNTWIGLTELWKTLGDYKKALESAKMAYFLDPYNIEVIVNYVSILRENEKYKDAQKVLSAALKIYPNNFDLLLQRALIELTAGKYEKAKKSFLKLISLKPPQEKVGLWAWVWIGLGHIEYVNGNYAKAMECAERALKLIPNDTDSLALKARIYAKLGELQKAIECYRKAYETTEDLSIKEIVLKKIRELETSLEE
ncbi:MAG: tetratricopeptide repeat protein [Candidatus Odinarchaeota archaeon]|nr:tetratricopeptide repeat protein [Candidatus Odinarchaeota archaeon]